MMAAKVPVRTPFERSAFLVSDMMAGLCESVAVNAAVRAALAEEAEISKLGNGTPPLTETVHIYLMWGQVAEMAAPEFH